MTSTLPSDPVESCSVEPAADFDGVPFDDRYEALLNGLQNCGFGAGCTRAIGIAGCRLGVGVSTVASNLALQAVRRGYGDVLLIDANVNRPRQHRNFSTSNQRGFVEALKGCTGLGQYLQPTDVAGLKLLTAGKRNRMIRPRSMNGRAMRRLIEQAKRQFDLIVVDLPVPTKRNHAMELASALDGTIIVVESEKDRAEHVSDLKKRLTHLNGRLLGAVLNKAQP